MTEGEPAGEQAPEGQPSGSRVPRWVLWVGLGLLAVVWLGICGAVVGTLDFLPSAEQPTLRG